MFFSKHSGVTHGLFGSDSALRCWNQNAHAPGSLRSPSDAAPKCFFKTFRCYGRLIFRKSSSAFSPKRSTFRFASLTLRCRTEMPLQDIPVLRSAYFPKKLFSFFSKMLDLQVRFALPPMGGGSFAPPCTPLSCPRRTRTDGQAESALDWVGKETARAAEGSAMRPHSGRRHGEAGRAVCLCGVRKGRMGGPEGVRGSRSAPGLPRRGSGGAASYGRPVKSVRREGGE